jgi:hypothetical protein
MAFVDPTIAKKLSPFNIEPIIWLGFFAILTFFLSIVQMKVSWKELSESHGRATKIYSDIKKETNYLLTAGIEISQENYSRLLDKYDFAGEACITVPERQFLQLKQKHKVKVLISKYLDTHPAVNICLIRLILSWKDNLSVFSKEGGIDGDNIRE